MNLNGYINNPLANLVFRHYLPFPLRLSERSIPENPFRVSVLPYIIYAVVLILKHPVYPVLLLASKRTGGSGSFRGWYTALRETGAQPYKC